MFKFEKVNDKLVITAWGSVGGWLDSSSIAMAFDTARQFGLSKVDIHLHTIGGSVLEGNLMYNQIVGFKGEVNIYVDLLAASMGAFLAISGAKLFIAENGFLMIHPPKGNVEGTAKDLLNGAKALRSMETNFVAKLARKLKKTEKVVTDEYFDGGDHWIDADEAVALGIADDKFTAIQGEITYSKEEAVKMGAQGLYNQYAAVFTEVQPKPSKMKLVNLKLKLTEDAQETDAVTAIDALEARASAAEQQLKIYQDREKAARDSEAAQLIATAQADQRITATAIPQWTSAFEKDHESAKAMLAGIPPRVNAKDVVEGGASEGDKKLLTMSWSELDKSGRALEMKSKFPEEYKELYKAEFGKYPKP